MRCGPIIDSRRFQRTDLTFTAQVLRRQTCSIACLPMKHWHLAASSLTIVEIGGRDIAIQAAMNFRYLRGLGVTVRKTIDTLIATRCIKNGLKLLHDDRAFDPFVKHLGLQVVRICLAAFALPLNLA